MNNVSSAHLLTIQNIDQAGAHPYRLFPSPVQMRPMFLPPSSTILFLYRRPSIAVQSLCRQTVYEEEASLTCIDLAKERVELYEWAQQVTGCEQSNTMIALISLKCPQRQAEE